VAGWHQYPTYTYDYARLIRLAHANGILVYVWLEPPQVNHKFWINHPEWREKNIKGDDAKASWRFPIALTDTGCVRAVMQEFRSILETYDWDGVNLAELYFEAGRGFEDPPSLYSCTPERKKRPQTALRYNAGIRFRFVIAFVLEKKSGCARRHNGVSRTKPYKSV